MERYRKKEKNNLPKKTGSLKTLAWDRRDRG
jgi:hypothetical protein